ncbi:MAG: Uma2 family endonuclease [Roseofilum sp. SBFL]|uniref:Uma2 family endonuclease n=1 Tax=unclassified Roseofilum TaxID=2620099 RepID=UPI001B13EA09|nr:MULTISPECIES: Uma2 family endonuclease [unclassified Roseofilum]MBP0011576.1 Uma2 family endonuclease [Roseofilum sp. SID3]MBP0026443.1 Uma2 family endonuclease [Roseofilum sp. SID2]MBP0036992.1 Uma2 family endonuclease [Roseofilum sp. SID1]MBP0042375.1 Uma2 family endonuclease [Roseofilum sp. SBFL]
MTQATIPETQAIAPQPQETQEHLFTFEEYLEYEGEPDILQELYRGKLIPMNTPTLKHCQICEFLVYQLQHYFANQNLSFVAKTIVGVRTEEKTSRIPDALVCEQALWEQVGDRGGAGVLDFAEKPILVVEVVSTNRRDDYVVKRNEYELAEIAEYWIIDPKKKQVRVFTNPTNEEGYEYTDFKETDTVVSPQFQDLVLSVQELLNPPLVEGLIKAEQEKLKTLEQEALSERQRAEKLADRLRELGIDPDELE